MSPLVAMTASLGLVAALAIALVLFLRRSLGDLLVELCGSERRARFWALLAVATVVLCAIEGALLALPGADDALWADAQALHTVMASLRTGVLGILFAFGALAFVLLLGVFRHAPDKAPTPSSSLRAPLPR